jgi:transposase-like protein
VNANRTLPIRFPPLPGEALDSWLEAIAHRTRTAWADLTAAVALTPPTPGGFRHSDWAVFLSGGEAAGIAAATGADPTTVEAMTLARFDGTAVDIDRARRRVVCTFPWSRPHGARYCPDCLAETGGRWQLHWRLGWAFACTIHRCLLADSCPRCFRRQRGQPTPGDTIPDPGRCGRPARWHGGASAPPRCGADLTRTDVARFPAGHPVLVAQQIVCDTIAAGTGSFGVYAEQPLSTRETLADVRTLAARALWHARHEDLAARLPAELATAYRQAKATKGSRDWPNPPDKPGSWAPTHAALAAAGVTVALQVLDAPDIASAGDRLRWLMRGGHHSGLVITPKTVRSWGRDTSATLAAVQLSALTPLLQPVHQLRYRTTADYPRHPESDERRVDRILRRLPTLLWPQWSLRFALPGCGHTETSVALAVATLLVGSRLSRTTAADMLGAAATPQTVSRILSQLAAHQHWPDANAALLRLADYLDITEVPIDYARRRALNYEDLLPDEQWTDICRRTLTPPGDATKADVIRRWLFQRLSGLPAHRAPSANSKYAFHTKLAALPRHLTPDLAAHLDHTARQFLTHHGLGEEPITWHPPLDLISGLDLPAIDPEEIDITTLHRLIRYERRSYSAAADQLGTSIDTVRHLLETHPAPESAAQLRIRGHASARARAALPENTFIELYHRQNRSLREIARSLDVSKATIATLARDYRIELRRPQPRPCIVIDRDWLHDQYVTRGRTLTQIAHETGVNRGTIKRWLTVHNLPCRTTTHRGCRSAAGVVATPTLIRPALVRPYGRQRLQRFIAATEHRTIDAAARTIGITPSTLTIQIMRLERELGGKLLVRAHGHHPMSLTPLGAEVLAVARDLEVPILAPL